MNGFAEVSVMEMEMVDGGQYPQDMYGSSTPKTPEPGVAQAMGKTLNPVAAVAVIGAGANILKSAMEGKITSPTSLLSAGLVGAAVALGASAASQVITKQ